VRQHGRVVDRRCPAGACRHLDRGGDARAGGALCQAAAHLFDWLVNGQVVPVNPAHSVRGPRHIVTARQTPLLELTSVVVPNADHWRNPGQREFYLSGLRLAAGEET
jgi:hypothetical protein